MPAATFVLHPAVQSGGVSCPSRPLGIQPCPRRKSLASDARKRLTGCSKASKPTWDSPVRRSSRFRSGSSSESNSGGENPLNPGIPPKKTLDGVIRSKYRKAVDSGSSRIEVMGPASAGNTPGPVGSPAYTGASGDIFASRRGLFNPPIVAARHRGVGDDPARPRPLPDRVGRRDLSRGERRLPPPVRPVRVRRPGMGRSSSGHRRTLPSLAGRAGPDAVRVRRAGGRRVGPVRPRRRIAFGVRPRPRLVRGRRSGAGRCPASGRRPLAPARPVLTRIDLARGAAARNFRAA
jgi:hypothetical protein